MKLPLKHVIGLSALIILSIGQAKAAQSIQEIQEYCQSMHSGSEGDEETRIYIEECINEQKSYLNQYDDSVQENDYSDEQAYSEPEAPDEYTSDNENYSEEAYQEPAYEQESHSPENETQDQDCYSKVDEQIQKLLENDPNSPFDYDQLLEQCLKGNH